MLVRRIPSSQDLMVRPRQTDKTDTKEGKGRDRQTGQWEQSRESGSASARGN